MIQQTEPPKLRAAKTTGFTASSMTNNRTSYGFGLLDEISIYPSAVKTKN